MLSPVNIRCFLLISLWEKHGLPNKTDLSWNRAPPFPGYATLGLSLFIDKDKVVVLLFKKDKVCKMLIELLAAMAVPGVWLICCTRFLQAFLFLILYSAVTALSL